MVSYLDCDTRGWMLKLRALWRSFFDVRPGEYLRTCFVALYLLFILFAYYILKPVSRALFLNSFEIEKLPYLMILVAFIGGFLAYLYTRLAVRTSLPTAVAWSTALTIGCLVVISWLLGMNRGWVLYVFNIWVGLFSVMMVAQGWLIAANVFTSREAKRLYGLLGMSAVVGAAFGGKFTADMVRAIGPRRLVLASAFMVLMAYLAFRALLRQKGVSLASARGAESEEAEFRFLDIVSAMQATWAFELGPPPLNVKLGNRHLRRTLNAPRSTGVTNSAIADQATGPFSALRMKVSSASTMPVTVDARLSRAAARKQLRQRNDVSRQTLARLAALRNLTRSTSA